MGLPLGRVESFASSWPAAGQGRDFVASSWPAAVQGTVGVSLSNTQFHVLWAEFPWSGPAAGQGRVSGFLCFVGVFIAKRYMDAVSHAQLAQRPVCSV